MLEEPTSLSQVFLPMGVLIKDYKTFQYINCQKEAMIDRYNLFSVYSVLIEALLRI